MSGITEAFFRNPKVGEWTDDIEPGLILIVREAARTGRKRKSWTLRVVVDGKRKKIGLGSCGLAEARRRAAEGRQLLRDGNDPSRRVQARQRAALQALEARQSMTFGQAAAKWLPRAPKLRNSKSELIRLRSLEHLAPVRDKPVTAISSADLVEILIPLRPETAIRVYAVSKAVFEFGAVLLEQEGVALSLPTALPKLRALGWSPRSRRSHKPMPALSWKRAPELLIELENRPEPIARVMIFILATASRCGAARMAKRRNIDLKAKTWTVPVEDLKDAKHRKQPLVVALNDVALSAIPPGRGEYVFTDYRGKPFTDQNVTHFVRKLRRKNPDWTDAATGRPFTAHGMRAMFRSWSAATRQDRDLTEINIGHTTAFGQVEGVYVRDDLVELRAQVMERWARHCVGDSAKVISLRLS